MTTFYYYDSTYPVPYEVYDDSHWMMLPYPHPSSSGSSPSIGPFLSSSPTNSFSILASPPTEWVPEEEDLTQGARKCLEERGIKYFLYRLGESNYQNSPQQWSQFPDQPPEQATIPGRYETIPIEMEDFLPAGHILQCQRCGTRCDPNWNIVDTNQDDDEENTILVLSYLHCPLGSIRKCSARSRPEWNAAEAYLLSTCKAQVYDELQQHLLRMKTTKISADVFEDTGLSRRTRDVFNAYRGLRIIWHEAMYLLLSEPDTVDEETRQMMNELPVWGDLMTDYTLAEKDLISHEQVAMAYGLTEEGMGYLYRWKSEWETEVGWLNTFAGLQGRMQHEKYEVCHYRAKCIGEALKALVQAEDKLDGTIDNLESYDAAKVCARTNFRLLHSLMVEVKN